MLTAFSRGYKLVMRARNALYDKAFLSTQKLNIPIISVGNLTLGGNGKTPLTIYLSNQLHSLGRCPVVLLRGYGGSTKVPHVVTETDDPQLVGDEACMLKRLYQLQVVVSPDRVAGAQLIVNQQLGDVIVMDDGFQHRRLARDLDIVSIDVSTKEAIGRFLENRCLPVGRFREDLVDALPRIDIAVLSRRSTRLVSEEDLAPLKEKLVSVPLLLNAGLKLGGISALNDPRKNCLEPQPIVAFCAIANPKGFFSTLESYGFSLLATRMFSDHYYFNRRDLDKLRREFSDVPLVCTEKDSVKLNSAHGENIFVCKVGCEVVEDVSLKATIERTLAKYP